MISIEISNICILSFSRKGCCKSHNGCARWNWKVTHTIPNARYKCLWRPWYDLPSQERHRIYIFLHHAGQRYVSHCKFLFYLGGGSDPMHGWEGKILPAVKSPVWLTGAYFFLFFNSLTSVIVFTRMVSNNPWCSLLAICSLRWTYNVTITHWKPSYSQPE